MSNQPKLLVKRLVPEAVIPTRGHKLSAGYDLYSIEEVTIEPGKRHPVETGLAIEVPNGTYGRVAPRSGMSLKHQADIAAGVIDADFRGHVKVIVVNNSAVNLSIVKKMKIAQLVLEKIVYAEVEEADELSDTTRGGNGFGSTGY